MFPRISRHIHYQRGVSLLEVLVAVVILSVGVLGLIGLQMSALRNNQSAAQRSSAVLYIQSIADAMRVDIDAAKNGQFDLDPTLALDEVPTGTSFAATQLVDWRTRISNSLGPDATGGVDCMADAGGAMTTCTITIQWDDSRGLLGEDQQTISLQVAL